MAKEAYVNFEIAKLLKEKGFGNSSCFYSYMEDGATKVTHWENELNLYPKPTHQVAMAWLREVHNIFIEIGISIDLNGNYHFCYTILDEKCRYVRKGYTDFDWNYEDAVEAAIKYCLENLI